MNDKSKDFMKNVELEFDYHNLILDDAYDLLEEAEYTSSKVKAKKLAKEAYEMCPECFDALLFLVRNEKRL